MKNKINTLEVVSMITKNKRVVISLIEQDKERFFIVQTKTLISFKDRNIITTDNVYSVDTFVALNSAFNHILSEPKIKHKTLLKEINSVNKWRCYSTIKKK